MSANTTAPRLIDPGQLAEQLGVPVKTIYIWRTRGKGPRGIRVGKHLRYRQSDIDAWLDSQADDRPAA
ncbi:helix-turn-helix transcriptional regulator [Cellulosimicrobium cellulans]|uniref:helix-turn-helix transcriptional regulator n=1 Tax=Cellulosimicrobium cellulans TaxID=1710 RepID=UPI0024075BB9|nr:helix-turn-helix domain-containing protein [Cellulosimicrobium cellulans]MDF9877479.1 excisionase family DNA binding protein [Cellulosimicrobium cellulans]